MAILPRFSTAALLLAALAAPAGAVFEDIPAGARQAGFGGAQAGLEDPLGFWANPALAGAARKFETGGHFLSSERTTLGPAEFRSYGAWLLVPRMAYGKMGTLSVGGQYRDDGGRFTQKAVSFGWGTWQLLRGGSGSLDFGASLKILSAAADGADSASGAAADLGLVFRPDSRHALGLAVLNLNNPSFDFGTVKDKAPTAIKLGVSERREDYTLSLDVTRRSAAGGRKGNVSLNPGVEHSWRTERAGLFFTRAGLFVAERASALSAGLGWRRQASELSYALAAPLTGALVPAHSLSLSLRFGDRDVQDEYERLIRQEIKYRKDLVEALDDSARREAALRKEMTELKAEVDALSARLKDTQAAKAAESGEKERLAAVVRRQQAAEAEMRALEEKRRADKLAQTRLAFNSEWQGYLKLKGGGAPADVLKSALQRIVTQYQDSNIDISLATVELQSLVR